jgi:hypothetical protein
MKLKNFRKTNKIYTEKEIKNKIEIFQTKIGLAHEMLIYHKSRPKSITGICGIVLLQEFGNLENAVKFQENEIKYCSEAIKHFKSKLTN